VSSCDAKASPESNLKTVSLSSVSPWPEWLVEEDEDELYLPPCPDNRFFCELERLKVDHPKNESRKILNAYESNLRKKQQRRARHPKARAGCQSPTYWMNVKNKYTATNQRKFSHMVAGDGASSNWMHNLQTDAKVQPANTMSGTSALNVHESKFTDVIEETFNSYSDRLGMEARTGVPATLPSSHPDMFFGIIVKTSAGAKHKFEVARDEALSFLADAVAGELGVETKEVRLVYRGQPVAFSCYPKEIDLLPGGTIHVVLRMVGGGHPRSSGTRRGVNADTDFTLRQDDLGKHDVKKQGLKVVRYCNDPNCGLNHTHEWVNEEFNQYKRRKAEEKKSDKKRKRKKVRHRECPHGAANNCALCKTPSLNGNSHAHTYKQMAAGHIARSAAVDEAVRKAKHPSARHTVLKRDNPWSVLGDIDDPDDYDVESESEDEEPERPSFESKKASMVAARNAEFDKAAKKCLLDKQLEREMKIEYDMAGVDEDAAAYTSLLAARVEAKGEPDGQLVAIVEDPEPASFAQLMSAFDTVLSSPNDPDVLDTAVSTAVNNTQNALVLKSGSSVDYPRPRGETLLSSAATPEWVATMGVPVYRPLATLESLEAENSPYRALFARAKRNIYVGTRAMESDDSWFTQLSKSMYNKCTREGTSTVAQKGDRGEILKLTSSCVTKRSFFGIELASSDPDDGTLNPYRAMGLTQCYEALIYTEIHDRLTTGEFNAVIVLNGDKPRTHITDDADLYLMSFFQQQDVPEEVRSALRLYGDTKVMTDTLIAIANTQALKKYRSGLARGDKVF